MSYRTLDDFVLGGVAVEYAERIASQRRAVLQRLASKRDLLLCSTDDEWAFVNDISRRSHALYQQGCCLLVSSCDPSDPSLATTSPEPTKQFERILDKLLQDVVTFDVMMAHWKSAMSEQSSSGVASGLPTDVMTCYTHAAIAMAPLRGGVSGGGLAVVESWKRLMASLRLTNGRNP